MRIQWITRRSVVIAAGLCCMSVARGDIIVEGFSLDVGPAQAPAPALGVDSLDRFDPTLGELNFVDVAIDGLLTLRLDMAPFIPDPQTGPLIQTVRSTLRHELDSGLGFAFNPVPEVQVLHSALSGIFLSQVVYSYRFRFDDSTDAFGFASVSGGSSASGGLTIVAAVDPVLAFGTRADFIDPAGGIGALTFLSAWSSTYLSTFQVNPLLFSYFGNMRVTYDYTPFPDDPPTSPVPEPATWLLIASGLAAVALRRRGVARSLHRS